MADPGQTLILALFGGIWLLWLIIMVAGVLATAFWLWMLVDCALRKFKTDTDKIVWILLLVFLHFLGATIYYFVIKRKSQS